MNITFVKAAAVRAVKTFAQTAVALIGVNTTGLLDVDWTGVASASALAAILSLLTSVAGLPEVDSRIELETEADAQSRYNDRTVEPYVREFTACEGCPGDCEGCPGE